MGPRVNGMQAFLSHLAEFLLERYFWGSNSHCLLPQPALAPPPRAAGAQCSCRWHIDGSYGDRACPRGAVPLLHRPAELGVWWSVPVPIPAPARQACCSVPAPRVGAMGVRVAGSCYGSCVATAARLQPPAVGPSVPQELMKYNALASCCHLPSLQEPFPKPRFLPGWGIIF